MIHAFLNRGRRVAGAGRSQAIRYFALNIRTWIHQNTAHLHSSYLVQIKLFYFPIRAAAQIIANQAIKEESRDRCFPYSW